MEVGEFKSLTTHKYWHYLFVSSLFVILLSALVLINGYLHFYNSASYNVSQLNYASLLLAGYFGIFLTIWIPPIPDYLLVPIYGYLCSLGSLTLWLLFLRVCLRAVIPIEYVCGRFAGRPLLLKGLSYFRITEKEFVVTDRWLVEHGHFPFLRRLSSHSSTGRHHRCWHVENELGQVYFSDYLWIRH